MYKFKYFAYDFEFIYRYCPLYLLTYTGDDYL